MSPEGANPKGREGIEKRIGHELGFEQLLGDELVPTPWLSLAAEKKYKCF